MTNERDDMMERQKVIANIKQGGLVAVVRARDADEALHITDACIDGGVSAIEITFTVPGALSVIESLCKAYKPDEILIGAGTVMDETTARMAILAGASYVVTPYFLPDVMRICNLYKTACMPGAMTVREVAMALEAGAEIIKVFPGEVVGPVFIKAVSGPLPQAELMPTGGVDLDNVGQWIKAGAVAVGVGGNLTRVQDGDYSVITRRAQEYLTRIWEARS